MFHSRCFLALGFAAPLFLTAPAPAADEPSFLRGDVNSDGQFSVSDLVMFVRLFEEDLVPPCADAVDTDDNGVVDGGEFIDFVVTLCFPSTPRIKAPFPQAGPDPTPDDAPPCLYETVPPGTSEDLIRIGEVTASPGQEVAVPFYLTNAAPIEAIQMVVKYDPAVFQKQAGKGLDFLGTAWEDSFSYTQLPEGGTAWFHSLNFFPEEGLLLLAIMPPLELPPGPERLLFRIQGKVAANATPGTTVRFEPTNGPNGRGVFDHLHLRNELTYGGETRFLSRLPVTEPGTLAIIEDVGFFVRGDANRDGLADISDVSFTLSYLFLEGTAPPCMDAADADDTGVIDLTDPVVMLGSLFLGAGSLPPPYPQEGIDPTPDALDRCPR